MNITILKEKHPSHKTGGEYTRTWVEIFVDPDLDISEQRECVVHAVLESYCPMWPHDKYDELMELILDGLDQLLLP